VKFVSPSYISGPEIAAEAGNLWDFAAWNDVTFTENTTVSLGDGLLGMDVAAGPLPGGSDAQIGLNTPQQFNGALYRYFSFRMHTDWGQPWPNMPDSMIVRVIWSIPGASGAPANLCHISSQDIPYDIGWQTVHVDMVDAFNGAPEASSEIDCPANEPSWGNSPIIRAVRFDPNENVTGRNPYSGPVTFHHQLDWVKVTARDRVNRGTPYRIEIDLNRPPGDLDSIVYYYTTTLSNPTQHRANQWSSTSGTEGYSHRVFAPLIGRGGAVGPSAFDTLPAIDSSFMWDTSGVNTGTYYICAVATIQPNGPITYCSQVPMLVL
jgi:hypothetical protein